MDLPINKEELDEIVDSLCNEHWDYNKREFRSKLYYKMKLVIERGTSFKYEYVDCIQVEEIIFNENNFYF